jgi:hypothetical protein
LQWGNHTKIDRSHITGIRRKVLPSRQRVRNTAKPERAREIVSTAARHNQDWNLQLDQLSQMTMHRPVAAEDQNGVGMVRIHRHINKPGCFWVLLEWLQIL